MTLRLIQELGIPLIKSPLPPVKYSNMVRGQVLGWANVGFHIDLVKQAQCVRVVELLPFSCVIGADTTKNLSIFQDLDSVQIAVNYVHVDEEEAAPLPMPPGH